VEDRNSRLRAVYEEAFPRLHELTNPRPDASGPLLIEVPGEYERARVKLLCVGQQTNGWPETSHGIDGLLKVYREFDLGRNYTSSPFWVACHRLSRALNPDGPGFSFTWSNLIKIDQDQGRPSPEVEESVCSLRLLEKEISILEPQVVVFFTGPRYDDRLRATFPGIKLDVGSRWFSALRHSALPTASFRTYHPGYLWRARQSGQILEIGRLATSLLRSAG